jgi:hypothetical protein
VRIITRDEAKLEHALPEEAAYAVLLEREDLVF